MSLAQSKAARPRPGHYLTRAGLSAVVVDKLPEDEHGLAMWRGYVETPAGREGVSWTVKGDVWIGGRPTSDFDLRERV
ncbi:hypothetical protein DFR24_2233 [Panacagrimonas perspica]|uniref:Uncharacterized protein n=1 Tax=Panacagrimonas perspica TaxID=381431 RepID=A0A4V3F6I9_9GAMM|nr:hypothetical protein [Panacagrimonas perspica]TDU32826.1 hypothetical protein DFR24_2233 [Panacagrimonas perspica]